MRLAIPRHNDDGGNMSNRAGRISTERGRQASGDPIPAALAGWTAVDLDLRADKIVDARAPVLRAASHAGEQEYVRVRMPGASWPLMAALQAAGQTYCIISEAEDAVEFLVWRRYGEEERRRYLLERVGRPIYEPPLRTGRTGRARAGDAVVAEAGATGVPKKRPTPVAA